MNSIALPQFVTRSLTEEDAPPWVGDETMPEYDRDDPYGHMGRPKNVVDFFWRLGYDLNNHDDFRRLADDFRWMANERRRAEESKPRRFSAAMTVLAAILGASATAVISWFLGKH